MTLQVAQIATRKLTMVNSLFNYGSEYLPIYFNQTEIDDINLLIKNNRTFYENIIKEKRDYTNIMLTEMNDILQSPFPRSFISVIRGRIGRKTGILKTTFGLQKCFLLDDNFSISERVGLTAEDLRLKIKKYSDKYSGKPQIFFLDEQNNDMKIGAYNRLKNIMEGCRERRLSFVCCGVPEEIPTGFADFYFERLGESSDEYLPEKTIYYMIRNDLNFSAFYRGIFRWNVLPLSNNFWKEKWKEYSELKDAYQNNVINAKSSAINYKALAKELFEEIKAKGNFFYEDKGSKGYLRQKVKTAFADYTNDDKSFIYSELCLMFEEGDK